MKAEREAPQLTPEEVALVRSFVIVQDDAFLALDKPAGLSSQGGRGQVNTLDELLYAFRRSNGNRRGWCTGSTATPPA